MAIPLAKFWYNTIVHSTPKKTLVGVVESFRSALWTAPHFRLDVVKSCAIPDLQHWLREHEK